MGNEVYYRRKAAHKCVNCGAPLPNEETRLCCYACREVKAEKQKTRYDARRERKLCTRCGKRPALPGTQVCAECREKVMVAVKRRRWAGIAFGLCLAIATANNVNAAEIDIRSEAVEIAEGPESAVEVLPELEPLGEYTITYYCPCRKCNGKWGAVDGFGKPLKWGTVAVDKKVLPMHTRLVIDGFDMIFEARDTGSGVKGKHIDVFVPVSHAEALRMGQGEKKKVWRVIE